MIAFFATQPPSFSIDQSRAVTGQVEAVIFVEFPKLDDLGRIIAKIQELKGVQRTQTLLVIPAPVRE